MTVCVVDGRGGGLGSRMIAGLRRQSGKGPLDSPAKKMLLPVNQRKIEVVGAEGRTLETLIDHAVGRIAGLLKPTA